MAVLVPELETVVAEAFARRTVPIGALAGDATRLAEMCLAMASRFARGGRLWVFGNGAGATDAQHIAVEFVHPVVVGKRALPALSLVSDAATLTGVGVREGLDRVYAHQLKVLGRPDDIALALSSDGHCANVREGLQAARAAGMLTVALVGGDGGAVHQDQGADHCLLVASHDPLVVKEGHVTAYHLLWELVHVFLDCPEAEHAASGIEQLYPFLYGGGTDGRDVVAAAAESVRQKVEEVLVLRRDVGEVQGPSIAACATELAAAFQAGGTLLVFGNGGSSTDAQDIVHTFVDPPGSAAPLPAVGLTNDVAVVTALANDVGFDVVFARQISAFGRSGDIAMAVSTSGGSGNVLAAIDAAAELGMVTVGLAGYGGGRMAETPALDHLFAVPSSSVHRVQEVQTTIYHVLWEAISHALAAGPQPRPPDRG